MEDQLITFVLEAGAEIQRNLGGSSFALYGESSTAHDQNV